MVWKVLPLFPPSLNEKPITNQRQQPAAVVVVVVSVYMSNNMTQVSSLFVLQLQLHLLLVLVFPYLLWLDKIVNNFAAFDAAHSHHFHHYKAKQKASPAKFGSLAFSPLCLTVYRLQRVKRMQFWRQRCISRFQFFNLIDKFHTKAHHH